MTTVYVVSRAYCDDNGREEFFPVYCAATLEDANAYIAYEHVLHPGEMDFRIRSFTLGVRNPVREMER